PFGSGGAGRPRQRGDERVQGHRSRARPGRRRARGPRSSAGAPRPAHRGGPAARVCRRGGRAARHDERRRARRAGAGRGGARWDAVRAEHRRAVPLPRRGDRRGGRDPGRPRARHGAARAQLSVLVTVLLRGGFVLPLTEGTRPLQADVLISGTRVAEIGAIGTKADETVDVSGCVLMPGLVQTHVHLVQTIFRGLAEDMALLDWLRGRVGYVYAPRFALSCSRGLLEAVTTLSKMNGLLVHTHSNENVDERTAVQNATGRTPIAYLVDVGIASERTIVAHGVHLDDQE